MLRFLIVSTTHLNKSNFPRNLVISTISFVSSFEIINAIIPNPHIFSWIAASAAAAAVNPNVFNMLLTKALSTFLREGEPVFSYVPRGLLRYPPECAIA